MIRGATTIPDGFNRKENHAGIETRFRESVKGGRSSSRSPSLIVFSGNRRGMSDEEGSKTVSSALKKVMPMAEDKNLLVCMELLNSKVNHRGLHVRPHEVGRGTGESGSDSPKFKLLYDIYHMQIMEGDVIRTIRDNFQYIGHLHTGGNPGRNELDDTQELNYKAIAKAVVDLGFQGLLRARVHSIARSSDVACGSDRFLRRLDRLTMTSTIPDDDPRRKLTIARADAADAVHVGLAGNTY